MAPFQHTKLVEAIFVEGLQLAISAKIFFLIFKASASKVQGNQVLGIKPILAILSRVSQEKILPICIQF